MSRLTACRWSISDCRFGTIPSSRPMSTVPLVNTGECPLPPVGGPRSTQRTMWRFLVFAGRAGGWSPVAAGGDSGSRSITDDAAASGWVGWRDTRAQSTPGVPASVLDFGPKATGGASASRERRVRKEHPLLADVLEGDGRLRALTRSRDRDDDALA